jgi:hypothetical protein
MISVFYLLQFQIKYVHYLAKRINPRTGHIFDTFFIHLLISFLVSVSLSYAIAFPILFVYHLGHMIYLYHTCLPYFNSLYILLLCHFNSCTFWCCYVIQSAFLYTRSFTHRFLSPWICLSMLNTSDKNYYKIVKQTLMFNSRLPNCCYVWDNLENIFQSDKPYITI